MPTYRIHTHQTQTVTTTVLRMFGASSWTGLVPNGFGQSRFEVTNISGSNVYLARVPAGAAVAGQVSTTDFSIVLSAGESAVIAMTSDYDIAIVSASSSQVRATPVQEVTF